MQEAAQETETYRRLKGELHEMGDVVTGAAAELYSIIRTPERPPPKEDTSLLSVGEEKQRENKWVSASASDIQDKEITFMPPKLFQRKPTHTWRSETALQHGNQHRISMCF